MERLPPSTITRIEIPTSSVLVPPASLARSLMVRPRRCLAPLRLVPVASSRFLRLPFRNPVVTGCSLVPVCWPLRCGVNSRDVFNRRCRGRRGEHSITLKQSKDYEYESKQITSRGRPRAWNDQPG